MDQQSIEIAGQQISYLESPGDQAASGGHLSDSDASTFAAAFTAPGSALTADEFMPDIMATDGTARSALMASIGQDRFADEVAIAAGLGRPLAVLHGAHEQLVSLDYLRGLAVPALWRGEVQLIPDAGHAPHQETPGQFTALLSDFMSDLE